MAESPPTKEPSTGAAPSRSSASRARRRARATGGRSGSGRWRTAPARAAGSAPAPRWRRPFHGGNPLLFADEPTTNLDLDGIETLQKQLRGYRGAVVLVSHDRALLDRVCTAIWAIEEGTVRVFPGGYSAWIAERDRERAFRQFEYDQYRAEKARRSRRRATCGKRRAGCGKCPGAWDSVRRGSTRAPPRSPRARWRRGPRRLSRRAERLEARERPGDLPEVRMALGAAHPVTAKTAARVEGLTVRYGPRTVLKDASFSLPTGSRTVMLGPNGTGKTTLLEHLMRDGECARFAEG